MNNDNAVSKNVFVKDLRGIFQRKILRNFDDYGSHVTLQKSIKYIANPLYKKIEFIIYELDLNKNHDIKEGNENLVLRMVEPHDRQTIHQIEEMEEWLKGKLKAKLEKNGLCMAILDKNQVAGFNLATTGEGFIKLLKLRIVTHPDEAWSEQITVHKDYRRRGLANLLRSSFYKELNKAGIRSLYGHRQEFNVASKKSAKKYTAQELCLATYLRVFNHEKLLFEKFNISNEKKDGVQRIKVKEKGKNKEYPFTIHIDSIR